jgi:hypothetical protein
MQLGSLVTKTVQGRDWVTTWPSLPLSDRTAHDAGLLG